MRLAAPVLVVVTLLVVTGCSYPEFGFAPEAGEPTDSGVTDTTATETSIADTSVDTGAVADSSIDTATTPDSVTTPDTVAPDTVVPDTAPKTGCALVTHDFCADWDSSSTEPTFGWAGSYLDKGTIALDAMHFSPPRSLLTTIPAGSGVAAASVSRVLPAPTADRMARVELRLRLDVDKYAARVLLVKLQRENHGASVWLGPAGLFAEAFGITYRTGDVPKPVTPGTWHRLRMEATIKTTGATIRVYFDDMATPALTMNDVSTALSDGTSRQLAVGPYIDSAAGYGAFSARYDDVSLDWI